MELKADRINTIIFDLDGTLVDTIPDVRLALNAMLKSYGLGAIPMEKMYGLIGSGAITTIRQAFTENGAQIGEAELHDALTLYLHHYKMNPVVETRIYPGVIEILEEFYQQQIKLGICTNKPSVMARLVLDTLKLSHYFSAIIGGDELPKPKPHGDHLRAVINKVGLATSRAVMVGDSEIDQACAAQAGIPFIGVSYGYHQGHLQTENIIHQFKELPQAIRNLSL